MDISSRIDHIAAALGMSREQLLSDDDPSGTDVERALIDGAPDQFKRWADRVTDPDKRERLIRIAAILADSKAIRGRP